MSGDIGVIDADDGDKKPEAQWKLNIRPLSSTSHPLSISLPPSSNISNLRTLIESKTSIPSSEQRLIYRGKMLSDYTPSPRSSTSHPTPVLLRTIPGLTDGCTIHLVPRTRPKSTSDPEKREQGGLGGSVSLPNSPNRDGSISNEDSPRSGFSGLASPAVASRESLSTSTSPNARIGDVSPSSDSFVTRAEALLSTIRNRRNNSRIGQGG
eukprot:CAMPEP_0118652874 /NCGR_PEP_ID=MMETSP0785-20121206/11545_1 /TAXON_ID=91992 /ORGANISM="Bolidomonas pacifica, Strain CCMP 1866" /LENGTH=209 /DNA_ID=CAMNT_0006545409 /DNA_START=197 /DNA_END=822 /DNA_ORIENTATION=-